MHIIILYTLIDYTSWLWQAVVLFWVLWIWLNMARQRKHAKVTGSPKMTGSTCDSSPSFAFASQRGQHPGSKSNMIKSSTRMKRGELGELQNSCPMVRLPLHSCGSFIKGFLDGIDGFVGLSSLVASVIFGHQISHRFRIPESDYQLSKQKRPSVPATFAYAWLSSFPGCSQLQWCHTAAVVATGCNTSNIQQQRQISNQSLQDMTLIFDQAQPICQCLALVLPKGFSASGASIFVEASGYANDWLPCLPTLLQVPLIASVMIHDQWSDHNINFYQIRLLWKIPNKLLQNIMANNHRIISMEHPVVFGEQLSALHQRHLPKPQKLCSVNATLLLQWHSAFRNKRSHGILPNVKIRSTMKVGHKVVPRLCNQIPDWLFKMHQNSTGGIVICRCQAILSSFQLWKAGLLTSGRSQPPFHSAI